MISYIFLPIPLSPIIVTQEMDIIHNCNAQQTLINFFLPLLSYGTPFPFIINSPNLVSFVIILIPVYYV